VIRVSYARNDDDAIVAYEGKSEELKGQIFFPHISLLNMVVEVNFGKVGYLAMTTMFTLYYSTPILLSI